MKFLILLVAICCAKSTLAQADCDALEISAKVIQDKYDIVSSLEKFYKTVKDFNYTEYKANCNDLLKNYNAAIDEIVTDLAACPGRQKKYKVAQFTIDFSCSFDKDFMKTFFSRFEEKLDQVCVSDFQDRCLGIGIDFCNPVIVGKIVKCAKVNLSEKYCGFEIDIFSKLLNLNQRDIYCRNNFISDLVL